MFAGIARFVARRHRLIIVVWVIALLLAIPLAPLAGSIVQYDETDMAPDSLESTAANNYISSNFGSSADQPTTIIVLTSQDILSDEAKRIAVAIRSDILNASLDGRINKVSVNSIYSVAETYVLNVLVALNTAYTGANLTAYMLYGMPEDFLSLWEGVNDSAHAIYGIPEDYAATWEDINEANPGQPVDAIDLQAYQAMREVVNASSGDLTPERKALLLGWFNAFASAWNGTAGLSTTPDHRAEAAHDEAFAPYVSSLQIGEEEKMLLMAINETFADQGITFSNVSAFAHDMAEAELDLKLTNVTSDLRGLVRGYFNATFEWWSTLESGPDRPTFEAGIASVATAFGQAITEPATRSFVLGLHQALGFAKYDDPAVRRLTISEFIATMPSVADEVAPSPWVVAAAGDLGANYALSKMVALSEAIVDNSSIQQFPVKIPSDIIGLLVSSDNTTMLIALTYNPVAGVSDPGKADVDTVRSIVAAAVSGSAIKVYVTGSDPIDIDLQDATLRDLEIIEPVTIILVLVLIGLFFRSFVASSIPPISIGIALGISYALVYIIGSFVMSVHYSVLTLMLTSMMGAGCDYCIFILSRYREERRNGRSKDESVHLAVMWAGESIATSGATVIIGFGVLSFGQFGLMKSMGVALALGVTIALLVALTLLPSLLMLLGDRMFWPAKMERPARVRSGAGYFTKSARFAIRHAKVVLVAAILISVPATYLVLTMQTSYDFIGSMAESESKEGLEALQGGFGGGTVTPTQIALVMSSEVVNGSAFNETELAAIEGVSAEIAALENVKQVIGPTRPNGVPIDYTNATLLERYGSTISRMVSPDGRSVLMTVVFVAEPYNKASIETIQDLRDVAVSVQGGSITAMYVGGSTASMYDIANMVQGDFAHIELLAIIGIYVVLLVVLGSVISPLKSILTILLSISWTLAITLVLFQAIFGQPVLYMVPLILLVVCLGLGMDYDILLITRMREEVTRGRGNNEAIVHAMESTGGIITACGIVMAAAFGSMMLSNGFLLKQFGFALMFAILLDATVVRIYLVPAIMALLDKWNWWAPGPFRRMNEKRDIARAEVLREAEEAPPPDGKAL